MATAATTCKRATAADRTAVRRLGRNDADDLARFLIGLDERARNARFHRHMSPDMVRDHCAALDWDTVIVAAWVADGVILGVCEAHVFRGRIAMEAEIALCMSDDGHDAGIDEILIARATSEAAKRGAQLGVMVLHRDDRAHADLMRRMGGIVDWDREIAILPLT